MKFRLSMTANAVSEEKKEKYQKLGFEFEKVEDQYYFGELINYRKIDKVIYLEIEKVEDLVKLMNEYGRLILRNSWDGKEKEIEIYNDYCE